MITSVPSSHFLILDSRPISTCMSPQQQQHHPNSSNASASPEQRALTITTTTKTREQSVPLHTLCRTCRAFFQTWEVLDWVIQNDRKPPAAREHAQHYYLCAVAHCLEFRQVCHFCAWLCGAMETRKVVDKVKSLNIFMAYITEEEGEGGRIDSFTALFGRERPAIDIPVELRNLSKFGLKSYNHEELSGFDSYITARHVPLHASDNVDRAKTWINTCRSDHRDCHEFQQRTVNQHVRQRPTRVLDLAGTTIQLRCDMANEQFEYLVLSYMWGEHHSQQVRLLRANLADFAREVPRARIEASTTFKEAVRLTRALGYRYLWIDSLCIIQDSPADWEYEARRMAIVYGNAACNLAFLFPPGGGHGLGPRGDPRANNPCILRHATSSLPGVYIEHRKQKGVTQQNWPLFERAWTFQEYLLSSRTLLVGHQNLMWHCSHLFCDELVGRIASRHDTAIEKTKYVEDMGKSRYFPITLHTLATARSLFKPTVLSFMIDWQNLINEYRLRKLTYSKDRVVAFAGIARAFQNLGGLTYLAGAWKEVFPLCLLWYMDKKMSHVVWQENSMPNGPMDDSIWTNEMQETAPIGVPTWSWFSAPIYRYYQLYFLLGEDELQVGCKSSLARPTVYCDDIFMVEGRQFQFGSSPPDAFPDTAFFEFADLRVTLEMPVLPVRVNLPKDLDERLLWLSENSDSDDDRQFSWQYVFNYYPDVPWGRKSPPKNAIYALLAEYQIVRTAGKYVVQRRLVGLMLVPGSQPGTWARLGVWKLNIRIWRIPVDVESLASIAQRWRDYAVVSSTWQTACITLV